MGVVSAVFGGVIRDVLSNEVPLIFRKEVYASACLAGGMVFLGMEFLQKGADINIVASIVVVILIRYLSVRYHWALPFRPLKER
jgi:uncharacterized membrane protein YeiH